MATLENFAVICVVSGNWDLPCWKLWTKMEH